MINDSYVEYFADQLDRTIDYTTEYTTEYISDVLYAREKFKKEKSKS